MQLGIVTLFPQMFAALEMGICGRALEQQLLAMQCWNPRDYTTDKHRTVDDRPYGGGPGMLMMFEPLQKSIHAAKAQLPRARVVQMSPQGQTLDHNLVTKLAKQEELILVCGRYEGIDERLIESEVDLEVSIGDYVLSGGELAAMVLIDAMCRLIPGALGHELSAEQDSFTTGLLDCPHYTRPEEVDGIGIPAVLKSGDHAKVKRWRLKQALGRTWLRRPDLLAVKQLTTEEETLLNEFKCEYNERGSNDD